MVKPIFASEDVTKLANMFSGEMRSALTEDEMAEVIEANRSSGRSCASHDVCDANMVMMEAWAKCFGVNDIDGDDAEQCGMWNGAWEMAKDNEFAARD
jgi:hypothetical protein|tara:strand:+ start:352 stop:645 length:294 start_codon:yes stop_codon:yes gene_type:complete